MTLLKDGITARTGCLGGYFGAENRWACNLALRQSRGLYRAAIAYRFIKKSPEVLTKIFFRFIACGSFMYRTLHESRCC